MKPGIYRNLSFTEYRGRRAYSPSLVCHGRVSMKKLDYIRHNPLAETDAMRFGSAVHCAVLEPDEFPLRYCVWESGRRAGAAYHDFCDANEGKSVLTADQYAACLAARDSARAHPIAGPLLRDLEPPDIEVSIVWNDDQTGLPCMGRADIYKPGGPLLDLKTSRIEIADDYALTRVASRLSYHIRLAAYQDGINTVTGAAPDCKLIFVEQKPPHDVRVKVIPDAVVAQGYDEWKLLLHQIAECERTGYWPGCDEGESELRVWDTGVEYATVTLDGVKL